MNEVQPNITNVFQASMKAKNNYLQLEAVYYCL